MKTIIATATLTIMFLSAGAFAGSNDSAPKVHKPSLKTNVTVIEKNMAWPLPTQVTVDPCRINRCIDI